MALSPTGLGFDPGDGVAGWVLPPVLVMVVLRKCDLGPLLKGGEDKGCPWSRDIVDAAGVGVWATVVVVVVGGGRLDWKVR